jgi:hypothetical protein
MKTLKPFAIARTFEKLAGVVAALLFFALMYFVATA